MKDAEYKRKFKQLHREGRTFQEMGEVFGRTRGAMSAYARELGLSRRRIRKQPNSLLVCSQCGKTFEIIYSMAEGRKFCSRKCFHRSVWKPKRLRKILLDATRAKYRAAHREKAKRVFKKWYKEKGHLPEYKAKRKVYMKAYYQAR